MKNVQKKNSVPLRLCAFAPSFTLIELMVVVVVIAILVGITIPVSKYIVRRAREASQRIYVEKLKSALEEYRGTYGEYPITPPAPLADVLRHYTVSYTTECHTTHYSPYTRVDMSTGTVETITNETGTLKRIDYALTYPLMLKQVEQGVRPFMEFKINTVLYIVWVHEVKDWLGMQQGIKGDRFLDIIKRKTKGGQTVTRTLLGIYGNPINRPMAIDPLSRQQWHYESDGTTYTITTNRFEEEL